jgi:hypothetical protein
MNTQAPDNLYNLYNLIAELVQELINLGYNENDLIYILQQHGITEEQAKEWYGIPYDND